jgi:putative ABC transport system ATP-binding protein
MSTALDDVREDRAEVGEVVISCENVHKTYLLGVEGVAALRGVSVDVYGGELLVIYGTSGGGKSTLLNVLGTIDTPTKGNLAIFDARITDRTPDRVLAGLRNKKVGFVFQSFNLLSTMSAEDNVALPMIIAGERSAAEIKARARDLLRQVGLGHRLGHYPSMLSGGEQQRVTIARALANDPDILLLDEPTGDLDTVNTHLVLSILMRLNREHRLTMAMVTHDVYMKQYAHRVLYLRDGKVFRVEQVDPATREQAVADLEETVARDKEHQAARRGGENPAGAVGGSPSAADTPGFNLSGQNTQQRVVVRQPGFYKTYSAKASPDRFMHTDRPALFDKLFPKVGTLQHQPPQQRHPAIGDGEAHARRGANNGADQEMQEI